MSSHSVLIYERDRESGSSLRDLLATWGYQAIVADDLHDAIQAVNEFKPSLVVDGGSSGSEEDFALVRRIRLSNEELPVVLLTGQGSIENAIHAIQQEGVYHYFEKPIDPHKLRLVLDRALELSQAKRENELLRRQLQDRGAFGELVGGADSMRKVYTLIEQGCQGLLEHIVQVEKLKVETSKA